MIQTAVPRPVGSQPRPLFMECKRKRMKRILVPVDFSAITSEVIEVAGNMGRRLGWPVTLLNVAPREPDVFGTQLLRREVHEPAPEDVAEDYAALQALANKIRESHGVECDIRMVRGTPVATILDEARRLESDLLIMGAHDRKSLFKKLMGSVSAGVLEQAPCPLMIIPAGRRRVSGSKDTRAA